MDSICQSRPQQMLDLNILHRTAFHGQQIVCLIHQTPIHDLLDFFPENQIQPYPRTAAIAFTKRMRNIHFYVFLDNLIEIRLRQLFDML